MICISFIEWTILIGDKKFYIQTIEIQTLIVEIILQRFCLLVDKQFIFNILLWHPNFIGVLDWSAIKNRENAILMLNLMNLHCSTGKGNSTRKKHTLSLSPVSNVKSHFILISCITLKKLKNHFLLISCITRKKPLYSYLLYPT